MRKEKKFKRVENGDRKKMRRELAKPELPSTDQIRITTDQCRRKIDQALTDLIGNNPDLAIELRTAADSSLSELDSAMKASLKLIERE